MMMKDENGLHDAIKRRKAGMIDLNIQIGPVGGAKEDPGKDEVMGDLAPEGVDENEAQDVAVEPEAVEAEEAAEEEGMGLLPDMEAMQAPEKEMLMAREQPRSLGDRVRMAMLKKK